MVAALQKNRPMLVSFAVVAVIFIWMAMANKGYTTAGVVLSGLTLGALYFLITAGLSLIFGLMDVLNFAHGLFFMFGAYVGFTVYANPRLLLNVLPLALAGIGALIIGGWLAGLIRGPTPGTPTARAATVVLGVAAPALVVLGFWGLDLLTLAAAMKTGASTGVVVVSEADSIYFMRVVELALAGLLGGLMRGWLEPGRARSGRRGWRGIVAGVVLVILAFGLVAGRESGTTTILAMDSNARFVLAMIAGALIGALLGGLVEWSLIRPLYVRPIYQVLLTLGLVFVGGEAVKAIWGPTGFNMDMPAQFAGRAKGVCSSTSTIMDWITKGCASFDVLGRPFPTYRLFLIILGGVMFVAIALLLRRSRLGMIIRAGVQDSEMVQALGINVRWIFTAVFALGTGLAALGGVAAAPFIGVYPDMGQEFLLLGFIAVVIGGMGSFSGAALGALLVGLARAFGDFLVTSLALNVPWSADPIHLSPSIARASTVLLMAVVLLLRPAGLLGKKD